MCYLQSIVTSVAFGGKINVFLFGLRSYRDIPGVVTERPKTRFENEVKPLR